MRLLKQSTITAALATTLTLGVFAPAQAQANDPNAFVQNIGDQTLNAFKQNSAARNGNIAAIQGIVNQHLMPNVDFQKTTRLAVGQPWRKATDAQKQQLTEGFKETLIRTYSGAFKNITPNTKITLQPFRGNAQAKDVVVRSSISAANGPVAVDYRLEKSGNTWKVYDFSVEGIWLIQNYRNQFTQEINRGGIDGLIKALQSHNIK
ncbi:MlaC/ttg2D family ABC transporter substrate-binding protein [Brackiella oedipodis]|uniref:MlaC/ttg2D family ABC transporter substrate-binding protein n=1 Tax=Brackiella oedipodis TaxID=124225 RepID=UPI00048F84EE|nr:ABC transporter substrate-binding protein [Brackiella oedipodis]